LLRLKPRVFVIERPGDGSSVIACNLEVISWGGR
jgi:hypothetical protein